MFKLLGEFSQHLMFLLENAYIVCYVQEPSGSHAMAYSRPFSGLEVVVKKHLNAKFCLAIGMSKCLPNENSKSKPSLRDV